MLSMDDIKYIKRLYESEGISIREIMRRTGYHYETIKRFPVIISGNCRLLRKTQPDYYNKYRIQ